jgi:predicted short-subunit dehydrogenase-like oxidoreductase (DUF2520 family)
LESAQKSQNWQNDSDIIERYDREGSIINAIHPAISVADPELFPA